MHTYEVGTRQRTNIVDIIRHSEKKIICSLRCKSIDMKQMRNDENEN
jgi:endogenous inhibitor of DNA gyrase (YacG/DUF329 family)